MQDMNNQPQYAAANPGLTNPSDMHARIADALAKLGICSRSVGQYGRSHPLVKEMAETALLALAELLIVQPTVTVACTGSYFALDCFPVEDGSGALASFAKSLHERGVTEISVKTGITADELVEFSETMSLAVEALMVYGGMSTELARRDITHIETRSGTMPTESREGRDAADIYEEALLLVEEAMKAVESGLRIPVPEIRTVVSDSLQSLIADDTALIALTGIRSYDRYLSEHSVNVCILSMVLGKDLGLDAASTLELGIAAMLHDVGKVFVPADIVRKPGKLTEEEWQQIRRHPAEGARALAGLLELPALASTIAMEHHLRADGTGYPSLPATHKPHLLSRLVAIVDTYDALTTDRPYRERWTGQQAIAWMLYQAPGQYDRQLLARFASHAHLYPVGTIVQLNSGDYAVVVGGNMKQPRNPIVRIIGGSSEQTEVDLSENQDPNFQIRHTAQPVEVLLPYADKLVA